MAGCQSDRNRFTIDRMDPIPEKNRSQESSSETTKANNLREGVDAAIRFIGMRDEMRDASSEASMSGAHFQFPAWKTHSSYISTSNSLGFQHRSVCDTSEADYSLVRTPTRLDNNPNNDTAFLKATGHDTSEGSQEMPDLAPHCHCYSSRFTCPLFCALYSSTPLSLPPSLFDSSVPRIRLICLKAGYANEILECSMFVASASDAVRFTALSYVWGNPIQRHPMSVNGSLISIGHNLYSALIHLRKPTSHSVLWVDAICINQNNTEEKNYQVQQMPRIYGAAETVTAWLGEAADVSDLAMDYISIYGRLKGSLTVLPLDTLTYETQEALNYLWFRPYWTRAWIVQELASARRSRNRCMIQCGSRSVSYNVLQKFLSSFLKTVPFTGSDPVLGPKRMLTLSSLTSNIPFLEILWESALLECTIPLDRIYGIRGISPQSYRDAIKVDYKLEFHKLCNKFMVHHIKRERSLDILCCFNKFPPLDRHPSWLCDLRNRDSGISPFAYSASAEHLAIAKISRGTLYAKGICISVVAEVKGPYQSSFSTTVDKYSGLNPCNLSLEEMAELAFATLQLRYPAEGDQTRERRFWHMVAGNHREAWGSSEAEYQNLCRQTWNRSCEVGLMSGGGSWEDHRNFSFSFDRILGRSFFTTADQHIGLGPSNIQSGDIVCILYGCSTCVVLREVPLGHTFVGSAYLDGAMSGEYVRARAIDGNGSKEIKFSIR